MRLRKRRIGGNDGSYVAPHQSVRVSIGSEHIVEVGEICEALRHMTHFLNPVSEAHDDTSLVVVVGFKVEIVVGVSSF